MLRQQLPGVAAAGDPNADLIGLVDAVMAHLEAGLPTAPVGQEPSRSRKADLSTPARRSRFHLDGVHLNRRGGWS